MASCRWACYGKAAQMCYKLDDCEHKRQMDAAPEWLADLLDDWYFEHMYSGNPLRERLVTEEFCRFCGASIPHRPGEGRCQRCMHHRPESEPIPPWERGKEQE